MPHASTWFANAPENTADPTSHGETAAAATIEDNDLAVASERISIKCPITLLPMRDPVTSQKCPHSFEKAAIMDMIRASSDTVSGSGRHGLKQTRCPICTVVG